MNDLCAHPVYMEIGRCYKVTYIAGANKGETYEGVITGDYERFYLMRLVSGTEQTLWKHHLYPGITTVCVSRFDIDDCAKKLIELYYDVVDYNKAIREGEAAQEKRRAAVDEIRALTNEFLENEKISPDRCPSEINQ